MKTIRVQFANSSKILSLNVYENCRYRGLIKEIKKRFRLKFDFILFFNSKKLNYCKIPLNYKFSHRDRVILKPLHRIKIFNKKVIKQLSSLVKVLLTMKKHSFEEIILLIHSIQPKFSSLINKKKSTFFTYLFMPLTRYEIRLLHNKNFNINLIENIKSIENKRNNNNSSACSVKNDAIQVPSNRNIMEDLTLSEHSNENDENFNSQFDNYINELFVFPPEEI
jgi:hypothetical protein